MFLFFFSVPLLSLSMLLLLSDSLQNTGVAASAVRSAAVIGEVNGQVQGAKGHDHVFPLVPESESDSESDSENPPKEKEESEKQRKARKNAEEDALLNKARKRANHERSVMKPQPQKRQKRDSADTKQKRRSKAFFQSPLPVTDGVPVEQQQASVTDLSEQTAAAALECLAAATTTTVPLVAPKGSFVVPEGQVVNVHSDADAGYFDLFSPLKWDPLKCDSV